MTIFLLKIPTSCKRSLFKKKQTYTYISGFNLKTIFALIAGILLSIPSFLVALGLINTNIFLNFTYEKASFIGFFNTKLKQA